MTTDKMGRFLNLRQVAESTGLSRSQVYRAIYWEDNPLPPPVKIRRRSYWLETEIVQWKERVVEATRGKQEETAKTEGESGTESNE